MLLPDVSGVRILVVGDVMLDRYITGTVDRISQEAPVPVVSVTDTEHRLGGAANVAANIVALGGQAMLLGVVGQDAAGAEVRRLLESAGIRASLLEHSRPTTCKTRILGPGGQQMLRMDTDADVGSDLAYQLAASVAWWVEMCDLVVLSDYGRGALQAARVMIDSAREGAATPVYVDPKGPWDRYRGATLIKPNESAALGRVGQWDGLEHLGRLVERAIGECGIAEAVVTLGADGMLHQRAYRDEYRHVQAAAIEVADVTGAGDTVMAVLALMGATGAPMADAMRAASLAAGIAVSRRGTAAVTRADMEGAAHA